MQYLPKEITCEIVKHADGASKACLRRVNKLFCAIIKKGAVDALAAAELFIDLLSNKIDASCINNINSLCNDNILNQKYTPNGICAMSIAMVEYCYMFNYDPRKYLDELLTLLPDLTFSCEYSKEFIDSMIKLIKLQGAKETSVDDLITTMEKIRSNAEKRTKTMHIFTYVGSGYINATTWVRIIKFDKIK